VLLSRVSESLTSCIPAQSLAKIDNRCSDAICFALGSVTRPDANAGNQHSGAMINGWPKTFRFHTSKIAYFVTGDQNCSEQIILRR
jgi:hypothetical protein